MDIGCIVLAGGKGLRLGQDKALETIGNKSLLEWVVFYLSFLNSDIIIVTATKQSPSYTRSVLALVRKSLNKDVSI